MKKYINNISTTILEIPPLERCNKTTCGKRHSVMCQTWARADTDTECERQWGVMIAAILPGMDFRTTHGTSRVTWRSRTLPQTRVKAPGSGEVSAVEPGGGACPHRT